MLKLRNSFQFWVPVKNYEGIYEISIIGVRRVGKSRLMKGVLSKVGYYVVALTVNNKTSLKYFHRLIAFHFIYNPERKKFINHKNGIKRDCRIVNLEWNTQAENNKHAYSSGLRTGDHKRVYRGAHCSAKPVIKFDDNGATQKFDCIMDAIDSSKRSVAYFIKNKKKDPDGFFWKQL